MKPTSSSNARYRLTASTLIRASPASRAATNSPEVFAAINRSNVGSSSAWVIRRGRHDVTLVPVVASGSTVAAAQQHHKSVELSTDLIDVSPFESKNDT